MKDIKKPIKKYQVTKIILFVIIVAVIGYIVYDRIFVSEDYQKAISHMQVEEVKKNEVVISMLPPKTLSPIVSTSADVQYVGRLMYSRLFKYDEKMTPVPDLADKFSFSGSKLKITLKDAKWHKGGKVLADDIIFSMEAIKKYGPKGPYFEKVNKIDSITGSGKELTVNFKDPKDISFAYLSFPIVSSETYKEEYEDGNKVIPQGSGMYKVNKYNYGKQIKCVANDDYYGNKAKSTLIVKMQKKGSAFDTLVETSNISVYFTNNVETESEITKDDMEIVSFPGNSVDFIGFNFKDSVCKNGYLRLALVHAISMDDIRKDYYYDSLIKSDSLFVPGFLDAEKIKEYEEDLEKSVEYLEKAGIADNDGDGIKEYSDHRKISLDILVDKNKKERVYTAEGLVDNFDDIGIKSKVVAVSNDEYKKKLADGDFDLFIGGLNVDETMDFRKLLSTGGDLNFTGFSDDELDAYMDLFMSGEGNDNNKTIVEEIKSVLHKKIPYYCIGYQKFDVIKAPALKGEMRPNFVNPYEGIETWTSVYEMVIVDDDDDKKKDVSDEEE